MPTWAAWAAWAAWATWASEPTPPTSLRGTGGPRRRARPFFVRRRRFGLGACDQPALRLRSCFAAMPRPRKSRSMGASPSRSPRPASACRGPPRVRRRATISGAPASPLQFHASRTPAHGTMSRFPRRSTPRTCSASSSSRSWTGRAARRGARASCLGRGRGRASWRSGAIPARASRSGAGAAGGFAYLDCLGFGEKTICAVALSHFELAKAERAIEELTTSRDPATLTDRELLDLWHDAGIVDVLEAVMQSLESSSATGWSPRGPRRRARRPVPRWAAGPSDPCQPRERRGDEGPEFGNPFRNPFRNPFGNDPSLTCR